MDSQIMCKIIITCQAEMTKGNSNDDDDNYQTRIIIIINNCSSSETLL